MHMDEGVLQAAMDDELPLAERDDVDRHLAACDRCSGELRAMRETRAELSAALRHLDVHPQILAARAGIQSQARRRSFRGGTAVLRRAAIFLIASAAVLSATVPGSPLRGWLSDAWQVAVRAPEQDTETVTLAAPEGEVQRIAPPTGVSLVPPPGRIRVVVSSPASGLELQVRLHDSERLSVWAVGAATSARFLTAADRIEVAAPGAGELRIEIPRAAEDVVVEVEGQPYLVKEGDRLRFPGPRADRSGPEIRFEVSP